MLALFKQFDKRQIITTKRLKIWLASVSPSLALPQLSCYHRLSQKGEVEPSQLLVYEKMDKNVGSRCDQTRRVHIG